MAVNTVGAVLGALACGFLFLETLGMWRTMQLLTVLYLIASLLFPLGWNVGSVVIKSAGAILLLMQFTTLDPSRLPINTDDRPLIEYMAPRTYRNRKDAIIPWYVGPRIAKLVDEVQRLSPPAADPMLVNRSTEDRRLPVAGAAYHWARIWDVIGDPVECGKSWERFLDAWLNKPPD